MGFVHDCNDIGALAGRTGNVILSASLEVSGSIFLVIEGLGEFLGGVSMISHALTQNGSVTFAIVAHFHVRRKIHGDFLAIILECLGDHVNDILSVRRWETRCFTGMTPNPTKRTKPKLKRNRLRVIP